MNGNGNEPAPGYVGFVGAPAGNIGTSAYKALVIVRKIPVKYAQSKSKVLTFS